MGKGWVDRRRKRERDISLFGFETPVPPSEPSSNKFQLSKFPQPSSPLSVPTLVLGLSVLHVLFVKHSDSL